MKCVDIFALVESAEFDEPDILSHTSRDIVAMYRSRLAMLYKVLVRRYDLVQSHQLTHPYAVRSIAVNPDVADLPDHSSMTTNATHRISYAHLYARDEDTAHKVEVELAQFNRNFDHQFHPMHTDGNQLHSTAVDAERKLYTQAKHLGLTSPDWLTQLASTDAGCEVTDEFSAVRLPSPAVDCLRRIGTLGMEADKFMGQRYINKFLSQCNALVVIFHNRSNQAHVLLNVEAGERVTSGVIISGDHFRSPDPQRPLSANNIDDIKLVPSLNIILHINVPATGRTSEDPLAYVLTPLTSNKMTMSSCGGAFAYVIATAADKLHLSMPKSLLTKKSKAVAVLNYLKHHGETARGPLLRTAANISSAGQPPLQVDYNAIDGHLYALKLITAHKPGKSWLVSITDAGRRVLQYLESHDAIPYTDVLKLTRS